ncbi:hypothetical protein WR25_08344 [Diploscapter pachys]|uniref:DNA polymerase delta subunit 3 n=1 Tax=Diploscapter pachys TaxID=2018661 RepID=A0A2A2JTM9_9BILA|nr:hypothetical protein WR25_08344 [Diploscapter pachys]
MFRMGLEDVDDEQMQELESLLKEEKLVATAITLARRLDAPISKAVRLMDKLWKEREKVPGLSAIYLVTGVKKHPTLYETEMDCSVLSKWDELDQTKQQFNYIKTETLYSLQCVPIETLHNVFEPEIDAVFSHYETDPKRAGIRCEETAKLRKERESLPARRGAKPVVIQRDSSAELASSSQASSTNQPKSKSLPKQPDLAKLFAKAASKEKTPRTSPKKLPVSPFSPIKSPKKEVEESPKVKQEVEEMQVDEDSPLKNNRRRNKRILIDDEDDWNGEPSKEEKEESPAKKRGGKAKKSLETKENHKEEGGSKRNASAKRKTIPVDEDLFDAEDEGNGRSTEEEAEDVKPAKKQKQPKTKSTPPPATRTSPRKRKLFPTASDNASPATKTISVTEEYVDEDGFTVTRQVKKVVELTEDEKKAEEESRTARKSTSDETESISSRSTASSKASKKVPAGQARISSFFNKK